MTRLHRCYVVSVGALWVSREMGLTAPGSRLDAPGEDSGVATRHYRSANAQVVGVLLFWTLARHGICSREHESDITAFLGACVTQDNQDTSADGIEIMDSSPQTLIAALKSIREIAANALDRIGTSQEKHSTRWKCKRCQYIKHFTNPVPLENAGRCPRCKSTEFRPVL